MDEVVDRPKKRGGWPKGKPRKPPVEVKTDEGFSPVEAPIHVRLRLKDYGGDIEFGCARRLVENGFHVFFYPSKRDPYRETRREFAIAEVVEIEITEARQVYDYRQLPPVVPTFPEPRIAFAEQESAPPAGAAPVVHSAKAWALKRLAEQKEGTGPTRIDAIPGITMGESAG